MAKHWSLIVVVVAACGSKAGTDADRYAVGTYLFTGNAVVGSTHCKFDAPPGVLDGTLIKQPGEITETCESGVTTKVIADYADHITVVFSKTVKVGDKMDLRFELRDAKDRQLTPTLSEMGDTTLSNGCTALTDLHRGGAQDTGRDPFMSATASAAGTCTVSIDVELPASGGTKKHHAEQVVTVN